MDEVLGAEFSNQGRMSTPSNLAPFPWYLSSLVDVAKDQTLWKELKTENEWGSNSDEGQEEARHNTIQKFMLRFDS